MAATVQLPAGALGAAEEPGSGVRYVARQPILDLRGKVHGYELLFRDGPEAVFRGDGDLATRTMLDNTVLFGLGRLTCGLPAFVNCTTEALTGELIHLLPSGMTVLEILESLNLTPILIAACRNLKAAGFRLALDDFTWKSGIEPLVELADYIKVDFSLVDSPARRRLLKRLGGITFALIAEKVETEEQFNQARDEGFTLVQGFYFCRPLLLENHKVPANRLAHIEILRLLHDDTIDLRKLTDLVKREASLTYRLLRFINSPVCAMRQEVRSVQTALMAVGEETFRRIATLAIASELNAGQPAEVLHMAFVRGRFCELAAELCALDRTEQYLLGLLSLLPAMLRLPMKDLAPSLPLREEIHRALLGENVAERGLLAWSERYERGDWGACDAIVEANKIEEKDLLRCYEEAMT
jgi:EAL and modified HD-GYP domain-containing signal transduction protein